jgi:hypothetical protein
VLGDWVDADGLIGITGKTVSIAHGNPENQSVTRLAAGETPAQFCENAVSLASGCRFRFNPDSASRFKG